MTSAIGRRAWAEPTVRFWWVLAAVLLVLSPLVGAGPVKRWQKLSKLSEQPPTPAKIVRTDRETVTGRPTLAGATVQIQLSSPDRTLWGTLDGWANGPLPRIGDVIDVRIDPDDANVWAVVHKVPPLTSALLTGIIIAAIAVLPLVVAIVLRRRVIAVWKTGDVREAVVLGHQQTALAPGAYALKCAWLETDAKSRTADADRAVFRVFVPKRLLAAIEHRGSTIQVLTIGGKRVAAEWFLAAGAKCS
jgi:hypothetical protein